MINEKLLVLVQSGENIRTVLNKADKLHDLNVKDPIGEMYEKRKERNSHYKWSDIEHEDGCWLD